MTAIQWMFRSRETGRLSIVSWPNWPLWTWIVATAVRRLTPVDGRAEYVLVVVGSLALAWWAVDEIVRGVNPWRRLLGSGVLVGMVVSAISG